MDSNPYKKFLVYASSNSYFPGSRVPFTGMDIALEYVKEKLEEGYTVHIVPYTQDEWALKSKGY